MFSTPTELQQFLRWCRENGIQRIKVGEVEAAILPPEDTTSNPALDEAAAVLSDSDLPKDDRLPASSVDRELLLWSAR